MHPGNTGSNPVRSIHGDVVQWENAMLAVSMSRVRVPPSPSMMQWPKWRGTWLQPRNVSDSQCRFESCLHLPLDVVAEGRGARLQSVSCRFESCLHLLRSSAIFCDLLEFVERPRSARCLTDRFGLGPEGCPSHAAGASRGRPFAVFNRVKVVPSANGHAHAVGSARLAVGGEGPLGAREPPPSSRPREASGFGRRWRARLTPGVASTPRVT